MVRFECDYAAGAHPKVLQALVDTNLEEHPGYGTDPHCDRARALLRDLCQAPDAHIHFLVGGTQANTTVISAALRPHQGSRHQDYHPQRFRQAGSRRVQPPVRRRRQLDGYPPRKVQAYRGHHAQGQDGGHAGRQELRRRILHVGGNAHGRFPSHAEVSFAIRETTGSAPYLSTKTALLPPFLQGSIRFLQHSIFVVTLDMTAFSSYLAYNYTLTTQKLVKLRS